MLHFPAKNAVHVPSNHACVLFRYVVPRLLHALPHLILHFVSVRYVPNLLLSLAFPNILSFPHQLSCPTTRSLAPWPPHLHSIPLIFIQLCSASKHVVSPSKVFTPNSSPSFHTNNNSAADTYRFPSILAFFLSAFCVCLLILLPVV